MIGFLRLFESRIACNVAKPSSAGTIRVLYHRPAMRT